MSEVGPSFFSPWARWPLCPLKIIFWVLPSEGHVRPPEEKLNKINNLLSAHVTFDQRVEVEPNKSRLVGIAERQGRAASDRDG